MNNMNVISLPAATTFQPEQALNSALGLDLTDVLIVGYTEDDELCVRSSNMTCAEALFLLEKAKGWTLSGGRNEEGDC